MTDHLSFNAARGPRRRDETAQRDGRRRSRRAPLTDRDLAELEALLRSDLQRPPSPTARRNDFRNWNPAPEPRPAPRFRPPTDDAPSADRRSLLARAMRFGATAFSMIALVGVSALLVLLAAGGEWPAAPVAGDPERAGAPVVTGSTGIDQDASRIPSQEFVAARIHGIVRAVDAREASLQTPQPAESWPVLAAPALTAPAAAEEPAAPTETAALNTDEGTAEPVQPQPAEPAAATQSARVTTHVNLRAGPDNDAAVVAVVPAGKDVGVVECARWCEVVYGGQQGFIHRRFMSGVQE